MYNIMYNIHNANYTISNTKKIHKKKNQFQLNLTTCNIHSFYLNTTEEFSCSRSTIFV